MNTQAAVEIAHLRKAYGAVVAVDDVRSRSRRERSSASSGRTVRARPRRSSACLASGHQMRDRSACWAWIRATTGRICM